MLRGETAPTDKWTAKDQLLAMALTVYEDGLCRGCGKPLSITTGEHPADFEKETYTCSGCAALEADEGENAKKLEPGEKVYLVQEQYNT